MSILNPDAALQAGQAQSHEDTPSPVAQIPPQPSQPTALSPFSGRSPHGQLQLLENMFQNLPQRHAKRAHQLHAAPAAGASDDHAALTPSSSLSQACTGPLHRNGDAQQPLAQSVVSREALGKEQGPTQEGEVSLKQPDSSTTPHSHHAFRLSFSPTGIPTVEPKQHLGTQAPPVEPPQHQGTRAAPSEFTEHQGPQVNPLDRLCTQAESLASGSVTDNHACRASGTASEVSQSSSSAAVAAAKPMAIRSMTLPDGLDCVSTASAGCLSADNGRDGPGPMVQAEAPQLQQVPKPSPAGADCFTHQAASAQPEAAAQVEAMTVATESPAQPELSPIALASAESSQSAAESVLLPADDAAQASVPVAGDAEGKLQSCTPGGPSCPRGLPLPSTPMLAWLDALGTPGSTLSSDVFKPSHGGEGVESVHEEHVPFGSAAQALRDESSPGLLAAAPEPPSEAVLHCDLSPVVLAKAGTELLPLSSSSLPLPTEALSDQATPGQLPHHAMPGPLPDQATPGPLPHQATPVSASTIPRKGVQATPHGWPRRAATPHMGPPTGLSGLTTPASAAEMHRYVGTQANL